MVRLWVFMGIGSFSRIPSSATGVLPRGFVWCRRTKTDARLQHVDSLYVWPMESRRGP